MLERRGVVCHRESERLQELLSRPGVIFVVRNGLQATEEFGKYLVVVRAVSDGERLQGVVLPLELGLQLLVEAAGGGEEGVEEEEQLSREDDPLARLDPRGVV